MDWYCPGVDLLSPLNQLSGGRGRGGRGDGIRPIRLDNLPLWLTTLNYIILQLTRNISIIETPLI